MIMLFSISFSRSSREILAASLTLPEADFTPLEVENVTAFSLGLRVTKGADTDHFKVDLTQATWVVRSDSASFHITGNRFLRGMVRLIVGACLNAGLGKISLDTLQDALDQQVLLPKSWSVPAEGLFLVKVVYPDF